MTLTQIQALVTKTAAYAGTAINVSGFVDGSGNPVDWTLKINVQALSDSNSANTPCVRFAFEDSVDGTTYLAGPTVSFKGTLANSFDKVKSFKKEDFPDLRIGVSNGLLRLHLTDLEATGSCTYQAWMES